MPVERQKGNRKEGRQEGQQESRKEGQERKVNKGRLLTEEADTLNSSGAILAGEGITYSANREMYPGLSLHRAVI